MTVAPPDATWSKPSRIMPVYGCLWLQQAKQINTRVSLLACLTCLVCQINQTLYGDPCFGMRCVELPAAHGICIVLRRDSGSHAEPPKAGTVSMCVTTVWLTQQLFLCAVPDVHVRVMCSQKCAASETQCYLPVAYCHHCALQVIDQCIQTCPLDCRRPLYGNIVLSVSPEVTQLLLPQQLQC